MQPFYLEKAYITPLLDPKTFFYIIFIIISPHIITMDSRTNLKKNLKKFKDQKKKTIKDLKFQLIFS